MICPRTQQHCYNPECGKTTGICATSMLQPQSLFTLEAMIESWNNGYMVGAETDEVSKYSEYAKTEYFKEKFGIKV